MRKSRQQVTKAQFSNAKKIWAGGFLYNPAEEKVLLHLRDGRTLHNPDKWALFGGLCEAGETPAACFSRELREEIGLLVSPDDAIFQYAHWRHDLATLRHVYLVLSEIPKCALTLREGAGMDWIPLADVLRLDVSPQTREDMEKFIAKLNRGSISPLTT